MRNSLFGLILGVCGALVCCAPNRGAIYPPELAAGERAESSGRVHEAAIHFENAAVGAKSPRDRDHARYRSALMLVREGDLANARGRLEMIVRERTKTEYADSAEYKLADLALQTSEQASEQGGGWAALEGFVANHPNSGLARQALHRLLEHYDGEKGESYSRSFLQALEKKLGASELGETIAYAIAERLLRSQDLPAARDAFLGVAARWPYPFGALFDDSLFHAAAIDEKLGCARCAIQHLTRMVVERETTSNMGSYQRPRFSEALFRIGVLYRDALADHVHARQAFRQLGAEYTSSTLRDDAYWAEAELWYRDHKFSEACDTLRTLKRQLPQSRYVRCVALYCPALVETPTAKKCPSYVQSKQSPPAAPGANP